MRSLKRDIPRDRDSVEFIRKVRLLRNRGYSTQQIAEKEHCGHGYVQSVFCLLKRGSPRLMAEIERGHIPHTIAMHIARAKNPEIQKILAEGYKAGTVNITQIIAIRQRIDEYGRENSNCNRRLREADAVTRHFSNETAKQQQLIQKAKFVKSRLMFITRAFKQLLSEGRFVALLHAEGIPTMPRWLAQRIMDSA